MIPKCAVTGIVLVSCSGCATMLPDTVTPEIEHMSHITQHEPFTRHPTTWGSDIASVQLGWRISHRMQFSVGEGVVLDKRQRANVPLYGETIGPREQFTARLTYTFEVHK